MTTDEAINAALEGVAKYIPDEVMNSVHDAIEKATEKLESTRRNERKESIFVKTESKSADPDVYTNLSDMLNVDQKNTTEFSAIIEGLYAKNRKYYTILRDYEIMPILIPQINRVLMFLANETLSPDIQNSHTFEMKYTGTGAGSTAIQKEIDDIRNEMDLDRTLQEVVMNRYKLGKDHRLVIDYQKTFDKMSDAIQQKMLNEAITFKNCDTVFDQLKDRLKTTINEATFTIPATKATTDNIELAIKEKISCNNLNIVIERSPIVECLESAQSELYLKEYKKYSIDMILDESFSGIMNEAPDTNFLKQFQSVVDDMRKKKLRRAHVERLDPARLFTLKLGKKVIGHFYVTDLFNESYIPYTSQLGQSLKDRLIKSRNQSTPTTPSVNGTEKAIAKTLAEKIIKAFDPNIGINRIEDIDLLHDYIINNEIYQGNKKITFYYVDDIIDMSRTEESLLINAVFFTKLYAMMILNNIITKVLRGRGRQIHTVKLGASNAVRKYLNNAIIALNNPESNLGMIHGSFEQLLNSLNSGSDIIIPSEDDSERFITTDYIEGQNVDMDTEFLRFLLNSIVASFGVDSAVIDATNGKVEFARTLSMESLQIANNVKNEQIDLYPGWTKYCLRIIEIMGSDEARKAAKNGLIKISFYEPKSLMIQTSLEEINNVSNYVDAIANMLPIFNSDNVGETERNTFVFMMMKNMLNLDWGMIESVLTESKILSNEQKIEDKIAEIIQSYKEHTEEHQLGDPTPEEAAEEEDLLSDEYGEDASLDDTYGESEFEEPQEEPETENTDETEDESTEEDNTETEDEETPEE